MIRNGILRFSRYSAHLNFSSHVSASFSEVKSLVGMAGLLTNMKKLPNNWLTGEAIISAQADINSIPFPCENASLEGRSIDLTLVTSAKNGYGLPLHIESLVSIILTDFSRSTSVILYWLYMMLSLIQTLMYSFSSEDSVILVSNKFVTN